MNTSAFSVIDVDKQEFLGAIVVDEPERGAAGIWSIACNDESVFISHSGTHEISVIDHKAMLEKFLNYPNKAVLDYDLTFLYGLRERIPLEGNGPRNMILNGDKLIIPTYFADILNIMDINTNEVTSVELNPEREETAENKGERYFNDASHCFQNWQSCNGCHPGDGRTDGMNWDLMNDGVGNSKNCKSMLFSHVTPPNMISGIRIAADTCLNGGIIRNFVKIHTSHYSCRMCTSVTRCVHNRKSCNGSLKPAIYSSFSTLLICDDAANMKITVFLKNFNCFSDILWCHILIRCIRGHRPERRLTVHHLHPDHRFVIRRRSV